MRPLPPRARPRRPGVTLVEMLVVVALLVLIMTILVQIFSSATGAITSSRAYAAINQDLRRVEALIRRDLVGDLSGSGGITAKMTPPNAPEDDRGYFVYGENALADLQGEDTDDYIAFTAKAPPGQPFTGTVVVAIPPDPTNPQVLYHRIAVTSDYAEIIYFLRNGNLYRRVLLILPQEWQSKITIGTDNTGLMTPGGRYLANTFPDQSDLRGLYGTDFSWLGLNDVSARPSDFSTASILPNNPTPLQIQAARDSYRPRLNTLEDLTNRQNRAFNPRHANDYINESGGPAGPDTLPDDRNGDDLADYYMTIYPQVVLTGQNGLWRVPLDANANDVVGPAILNDPNALDHLAFPFVYPNAYSKPDPFTLAFGRIHSLDPTTDTVNFASRSYPRVFNHGPLDLGEDLSSADIRAITEPAQYQTWWCFPTKKETLSPNWTDPVKRLNDPANAYFYTVTTTETPLRQALGLQAANVPQTLNDIRLLPPMDATRGTRGLQPFNDGAGSTSFQLGANQLFQALPEDDLILSGVRSFDVKALETRRYYKTAAGINAGVPDLPPQSSYVDLGYGNLVDGLPPPGAAVTARSVQVPSDIRDNAGNALYYWDISEMFAHEGRIPPLPADLRGDGYNPNIGQDDPAGGPPITRLRRVWDSWSTRYSSNRKKEVGGRIFSPNPPYATRPALPSYPPPYPTPLSGIQIQIRAVDPQNLRMRSLTIRHDFTDRL